MSKKLPNDQKKSKLKNLLYSAWRALCEFDIRPATPKRQGVLSLFESYADIFDHSLVELLDYQAPKVIADKCSKLIPKNLEVTKVLDLGCGTGLLGSELINVFTIRQLVGVDFSKNMLSLCAKKNLYDVLHRQEICQFIMIDKCQYDFIAAADVFVYIGDLYPILHHAYPRIKPGGFFAFTIEAPSSGRGYYIDPKTRRFQHSLNYVTTLYNNSKYCKISTQPLDIRKESGYPVAGHLVILHK